MIDIKLFNEVERENARTKADYNRRVQALAEETARMIALQRQHDELAAEGAGGGAGAKGLWVSQDATSAPTPDHDPMDDVVAYLGKTPMQDTSEVEAPMQDTSEVAAPRATSTRHKVENPSVYKSTIEGLASRYGIPSSLLMSVVHTESRFNQGAVSPTGAIGLMQLMPGTARDLGVDPTDSMQNLEGGARYLKQQLDRFGSVPLALAAYNAGPNAVKKYGGVPPFKETRDYVDKVMQDADKYADGGLVGLYQKYEDGGKVKDYSGVIGDIYKPQDSDFKDLAMSYGQPDNDNLGARLEDATPLERSVYNKTGLEPGVERPILIPRYNSETGWTAPEIVVQGAKTLYAGKEAWEGTPITPEETLSMAALISPAGIGSGSFAKLAQIRAASPKWVWSAGGHGVPQELRALAEKNKVDMPALPAHTPQLPSVSQKYESNLPVKRGETALTTSKPQINLPIAQSDPIIQHGNYDLHDFSDESGRAVYPVLRGTKIPEFKTLEEAHNNAEAVNTALINKHGFEDAGRFPPDTYIGGFSDLPFPKTKMSLDEISQLRAAFAGVSKVSEKLHNANMKSINNTIDDANKGFSFHGGDFSGLSKDLSQTFSNLLRSRRSDIAMGIEPHLSPNQKRLLIGDIFSTLSDRIPHGGFGSPMNNMDTAKDLWSSGIAGYNPQPLIDHANKIADSVLKLPPQINLPIVAKSSSLEGLPIFNESAYRSDTGYSHGPKDTAADVINFESDELGNVSDFEHLTPEILAELKKYPAKRIKWVTKNEKDASRYGSPENISDRVKGGRIIAEDGDGGYLILTPEPKPKKFAKGGLVGLYQKYEGGGKAALSPDKVKQIIADEKQFAKNWFAERDLLPFNKAIMAYNLNQDNPIEYRDVIDNDPTTLAQTEGKKIILTPGADENAVREETEHTARDWAIPTRLYDAGVYQGNRKTLDQYTKDFKSGNIKGTYPADTDTYQMYAYLNKPEEGHARLMELRRLAKFNPKQKISQEDLDNFYKNYDKKSHRVNQLLDMTNDTGLIEMLNYMSKNDSRPDKQELINALTNKNYV